MDITNLNVEQLKSLAYDSKKEVERHQQNLAVIENQLAIKMQADAQAKIEALEAPKDGGSPASTGDGAEASGDG